MRSTLTDEDMAILHRYESWDDPTEPNELADYINALAHMVIDGSVEGSYDVTKLMEMNGVAKDLRNGEKSVADAKEWMGDLDVSK